MSAPRPSPSPRRRQTSSTLLGVLIAVGFAVCDGRPAWAEPAGERLISGWADTLRASGARVAWSGLDRSDGDDRIDLRDVEIDATVAGAEVAIRLPNAGFTGLADRAGGGFTVRAVTAPRIEVTVRAGGATHRLTAADVDGRDVAVPAFVLPKSDPDHLFTSSWGLLRMFDPLAAGRAAVGRVTLTTTGPSPTPEATWRSEIDGIAFTGVGGGRIDGLRFGALSAKGPGATLTSAGGEIAGWDFGPLYRLFDDDAYVDGKGDGVWRPVLTSAELGATSFTGPGSELSVGRLVSGRRELRQFDEPLGRLFDRAYRPGGEPTQAESLRLAIDLFHTARSQGWSAERLHLTGTDANPGTFDIARIAFGAFSGEGIEDASIEGLDAVTPNAVLRLGGLRLRDLRLPDRDDLKRAVAAAASGAEIDPSSLIPTLAGLRLDRLEAREGTSETVRLESFDVVFARHIRAVPTSATLALSHFVVPVAIGDQETRKTLGRLGYRQVDFSAALRVDWREAANALVVEEASAEVGEAGRLALTGRLTGVPRSLFLRPETFATALAGIRLAEAKATWTDASFFGRVLAMVAEDQHLKPERLRRKLSAGIAPSFSDVRDPARRKRMVEAVRRFIAAPTTISAEATPAQPIPILELGDLFAAPAGFVERLDLTIGAGH